MNYMCCTIRMFGFDWNVYNHTKWDSSRYDNAYFGLDGVAEVVNPSKLRLYITKAPMHFEKSKVEPVENGSVIKHWCCGEVNGPEMSYGTYIWKVTLPETKNIWPALWLCGKESWPPEIDVVEGYTEDCGNYVKNLFTTKLETNFHIRQNHIKDTHINVGAKGIPTLIYKIWHKAVDEYKCIWTPTSIKIYFNGILIRKMTDKAVLADFNVCPKVYPIMNMMVDDGYVHDDNKRPYMDIEYFNYIPLKK